MLRSAQLQSWPRPLRERPRLRRGWGSEHQDALLRLSEFEDEYSSRWRLQNKAMRRTWNLDPHPPLEDERRSLIERGQDPDCCIAGLHPRPGSTLTPGADAVPSPASGRGL